MIYVTGDIHADLDRFKGKEAKKLKKGDTLIVCGDFGFVWDGSKKEQQVLKWIGKRPYQVLFIEGTHDNLSLLDTYPPVDFRGGRARQISGRCYHLLRGEVYTIESDQIFTFGGGESFDADTRIEGQTWWPGELPTQQELAHARETLERCGHVVDYIITHEASSIVKGFLNMDSLHTNQMLAFFDELSKTVRYKQWFFGGCHLDKVIPPKHRAVYQQIVPLKAMR